MLMNMNRKIIRKVRFSAKPIPNHQMLVSKFLHQAYF